MNLVPLGSRVIIRKPPKPAESKTSTGLFLAQPAEAKNEGEVVAIGEDVKTILPGDVVLYPEYGAIELTEDKVDYLILDVVDLVAVRTPVKVLNRSKGE